MSLKPTILTVITLASVAITAMAVDGTPYIHDPSTIVKCDGKYYTFGTGGGGLISDDGWTWHQGAIRPGGGAAPDALKIGDRYLVAYSSTGGGLGGGHAGRILTMWTKTLDPSSPDFGFTEPIEVAASLDDEDCDAIDAGLLLDPTTGRLWCTYGTYFGFIRIVELDPATGKRVEGNQPVNIAIDCEATDLIYRNGWYYLLGTHGTCCDGANSTYNIVVGRSRSVTGPYLDNIGRDMLRGGGKMLIAANNLQTGPGHFGRYIVDDGVEKMSFHYEADFARSGRSVLEILPLLWRDDWPVAGTKVKPATYQIQSQRRGYSLELAVDFIRMPRTRHIFWGDTTQTVTPIQPQTLADVIDTWPAAPIQIRMSDYMFRPHQHWSIQPEPQAPGFLGGQFCKIVIEGTDLALTATPDAEVIAMPYSKAPEQLWQIDQLTDGTFRIMPMLTPSHPEEQLVLTSAADSTPTLAPYCAWSDNSKWNLIQP